MTNTKWKIDIGLLLIVSMMMLVIPAACGVTVGGGSSVTINDKPGYSGGIFTADRSGASSVIQVTGHVESLVDSHWVEDRLGNRAEVGMSVKNGDIVDYRTRISPKEGLLRSKGAQLSAEEFLTIEAADSIEAYAEAQSKEGTANERLSLSSIRCEGLASLTDYSNKAYITRNGEVGVSQAVQSAKGEEVTLETKAKDGNQLSRIEVGIAKNDVYGAEFNSGSTDAVAGASTKAVLDGHILGALKVNVEANNGIETLNTLHAPTYGVEYRLHSEAETSGAGASLSNELGYCIDDDRFETIQEAIDDAYGDDPSDDNPYWHNTVYIAPGEYDGATISKSVNVIGSDSFGPDKTTINGNGAGSVFEITPCVTTTLADMEITGGSAYQGGGIYNYEGILTVRNCDIHDNTAENAGGGIFNYAGSGMALTTVVDCDIHDDTISPLTGEIHGGGGICNYADYGTASTSVINSNIYRNAVEDWDSFGGWGGTGGGIFNYARYNTASASAMVTTSNIYDNIALFGGGIDNFAWEGTGSTTVTGSNVYDNTAHGGGGIFNLGWRGTALTNVIDCDIHDNIANAGGGIGSEAGLGTALMTVTNSDIHDNTAYYHGGGIYTLASTQATASAILNVDKSYIHDNTAMEGGGIRNKGGNAVVIVAKSDIYNNAAHIGGGIVNIPSFNTASTSTTVTKSKIYGNTADYGGGLYNLGILTIMNCDIYENSADYYGGGIYNQPEFSTASAILDVENSNIHDNTARKGGGIWNSDGPGTLASATVTKSNMYHNTANEYGGGIWNDGVLTVDRSFVMFNTAGADGGGIWNGGDLTNIWSWVLFNRPDNVFNA